MSFDYNKLRGRIVEKYGSIAKFSEKLTIDYPAVIRKMAGGTKFTQQDIVNWCRLLNIDINDAPDYFLREKVQSDDNEQEEEKHVFS